MGSADLRSEETKRQAAHCDGAEKLQMETTWYAGDAENGDTAVKANRNIIQPGCHHGLEGDRHPAQVRHQ